MKNIMIENHSSSPASRPIKPMLAFCAVGFSLALPQVSVRAEAQTEPQIQLEASLTPSAQALSQQFREFKRRRSAIQGDCSAVQTWSEADLDYLDMDQVTRAAISAPAIQVTEDDKRMYAGLSAPRFAFDEEAVPVNRTHIAIAELRAAFAPPVVLDNEALQALASIQTSFPRSIEIDFGGE